jgi:catechol 2,3-dioxygenase-like lactoylglutathione lyase family enzyme
MPAEMPSFFRGAVDGMEYLGPEPDRWRSTLEPSLKNVQEPEHYIDLELLDGFGELPRKRFDFYRKLEAFRLSDSAPNAAVTALAGKAPAMQAKRDLLLPDKIGLQPWITVEVYERLVVAFREYRALLKEGKPTRNAEENAIFYAGWLGHYVGDGANPMHTTIYYNGWVGANPNDYTTSKTTHYEFESRFVHDNIKQDEIVPLLHPAARVQGDIYADYVQYLRDSNRLVEKTYQREKAGAFKDAGTREGREFVRGRLAAGSQKLIDLCYTAWFDSEKEPPPYKTLRKLEPEPTRA